MPAFDSGIHRSFVCRLIPPSLSRSNSRSPNSFDQGLPSIASLPRYFGDKGYSSPNDYLAGPFQYGHKTTMETYSYWLTQPTVIDNFNVFMQGGKLKKTKKWTGVLVYQVPRIMLTCRRLVFDGKIHN